MLQRSMILLNQIDWRLRRAAGQRCRRTKMGTGVVLDSLLAYKAAERPAIGALLQLGELPQIVGVAADSPGEMAGLAAGDRVVAVDGLPSMDLMTREGSSYTLPENVLENIGTMSQSALIHFEVERDGKRVSLNAVAVPVCAGMTVLKAARAADAFSDSDNIAVTAGMVSMFDNPDELAFIIGHELAHIIFEDSKIHRISRLRKEERADLYGTFLATCGGFRPEGAIAALGKLKSKARGIPSIPWLHKSFSQRQKVIEAFIARSINCQEEFLLP